jgi:small subunit ribosomal protein S20
LANKRSALKAHRQSETRRLRNRAVRSEVRTYVKKARVGIAAGASEEATAAVVDAARELDKAANKNVIHPNQAARRKSRLMKQLAALGSTQTEEKKAAAPKTTRRRTTSTTSKSAASKSTATKSTTPRTTRTPRTPK